MAELLTFAEINALASSCKSFDVDCKRARAIKFGTWSLTLAPLIGREVGMVADLSRGFLWFKSTHRAWYKTLRYRSLASQRLLCYARVDPRLTDTQRGAVSSAIMSWSTCRQRDREWYRWYVMDVVMWAPRRLSAPQCSALELAVSPPFADITTPHWRMWRRPGRVDFVGRRKTERENGAGAWSECLGATFARGCLWFTKCGAFDFDLLSLLFNLTVRPVITTLNHCKHCPFCSGPLLVECRCYHAYAGWFAAASSNSGGGVYAGAVAEYARGGPSAAPIGLLGDQQADMVTGECGELSRHGVSGLVVYGEKPP